MKLAHEIAIIPDRLLRRWLERPAALRRGLVALGTYALGYALCLLLLALGGARPGAAPWLAIPTADYFLWESLFIAPVIVCGGVLAAALAHLIALALGGRGTFEDTMALIGVSTAFASLTTLVPDTVVALLLCAGIVDSAAWMTAITSATPTLAVVWGYLALYLVAFGIGYPAAARVAHRLPRGRARLVGWTSFAVYQTLLYVFVR